MLILLYLFLAWHFGHFTHSSLILPPDVFAPLPYEPCQSGDRAMWPWFDFSLAVPLHLSSCLEPSKLQVSPVPPCVTALKHLKTCFVLSSTLPIRIKNGYNHLGDFETAKFLEQRLI